MIDHLFPIILCLVTVTEVAPADFADFARLLSVMAEYSEYPSEF